MHCGARRCSRLCPSRKIDRGEQQRRDKQSRTPVHIDFLLSGAEYAPRKYYTWVGRGVRRAGQTVTFCGAGTTTPSDARTRNQKLAAPARQAALAPRNARANSPVWATIQPVSVGATMPATFPDRKSTRLNSSHLGISY